MFMTKASKKAPYQTSLLSAIKKGGGFGASQAAQAIQDEIFRKMMADEKIKLASQSWSLAKELSKDKVYYGINRSKTAELDLFD